jgi:hypothetical protein
MKLARIVLPQRDNAGRTLYLQHQQLRLDLIDRWGGYTTFEGVGGWRNGERDQVEPVWIYDVAMYCADASRLRTLAAHYAKLTGQKSVMIVTPNGDVDFVEPVQQEVVA